MKFGSALYSIASIGGESSGLQRGSRVIVSYRSDQKNFTDWYRDAVRGPCSAAIKGTVVKVMHPNEVAHCVARDDQAAELDQSSGVDSHCRND